jgi:hypothetical protein
MSKKDKSEEKEKTTVSDEVNSKDESVKNTDKEKNETPPPEGQMFVKVYSPFKVYFDSLASSITAENDTGVFDILAGHHKFLTLLSPCEIKINSAVETESENIKIDRGIMYVKEDRVTVFLDV